ncbi:uncharacterized protein EI90DRAFT_690195 [Cantharellus anzutake]|uniref:uncharacterized protein n=1 Tax=Cantharellus anzutake TaxID=1750568 RepID=UPI00190565B6|nr:uncharacterized protein EI90DRAFT_690195 [Cantharellus anzutake]KAF8332710.1 hypothetical protein EI90DRAFT_690195 [Cantharellus anzutake]
MKRGPRSGSALGIRTDIVSSISGGPPSPTLSASTQVSGMPVPGGPTTIITRAHLRTSVQAYEETSTDYRNALSTLADASARFAAAIESCSRLRGVSDDASVSFQAAGGLYHIIGNHEQVLSDAIRKKFDKPLRQHLQAYRQQIAERSAAYEQSLIEKNRLIRKVEAENMNIGRRRQRDLNSFRAALNLLQQQVAELDRLKADYYSEVLGHEEESWDFVLGKVSLVVRSTLDVYDRISAKASDPGLESMLLSIPDPFDTYGPQKSEDHIYSIVPVGILNPNDRSSPSPAPSHHSGISNVTGVQTWMDQTATARETAYPSQPVIPDWTNVDWTDAESRVRRHSLPGPYPTASNHVPASLIGTTSLSTSPPSASIPFPKNHHLKGTLELCLVPICGTC